MTTAVSVFTVLKRATAQKLTDELITGVSDDSKAGIAQMGIVRGMHNDAKITVVVKTGDEKWRHTSNMSSQDVGMKAPFGEIGGGLFERLRFIIEYELFFPANVSQDQAAEIADVVLSRVRQALSNQNVDGTWWFPLTPDDFGEVASRVFVYDSYMTEGGSEGKWTWRGETRLEFLTERTGCV